ncbi:hypothetical protein BV20DRAFT_489466 [Pilatotrama ljubarskyi]|nr:hypothetical protein BV20DRAFT_489466 [Pilatotrama ljubarskyi]
MSMTLRAGDATRTMTTASGTLHPSASPSHSTTIHSFTALSCSHSARKNAHCRAHIRW